VGEIAEVAGDDLYDPLADVYDELVTTGVGAPADGFADGEGADEALAAGQAEDDAPAEGEAEDEEFADEAAEDEALERLGDMIRERWRGQDEEPPDSLGDAPAEPDDAGENAPADEVGEEAVPGDEAPDEEGAPDDAAAADAPGNDAPGDEGAPNDAPDDPPAPDDAPAADDAPAPADEAPDEEAAPAGDDAPAADAPTDPAAAAAPSPVPGFIMWSPDGQPLDGVVLGEPFLMELRVFPDESGLRGRQGGLREFDFVNVTIRSEDGAEHWVRLHRQDEPSADGLVRFTAQEPISLEGTWRKPDGVVLHDGTVDALDLDVAGSEVLQVITPGVTGGATAVRVFGDPIEAELAMQERRLQEIEDILTDERRVAEAILADSAIALHPELEAETRAWLERTERLLDIVDVAQQRIADTEHPVHKLRFANAYMSTILTSDRNGSVVIVEQVPPYTQIADALERERRVGEEDLRAQAWRQATGYATLSYSLFAHGTLAAPVHQLIYGRDEFDREGSRVWAAVELGTGIAMVFLPGAIASRITEWKAGGFSLDIRLQRPGGASPGAGVIRSRPGQLAAITRRGADADAAYPGVLRPTPKPPRPGGMGTLGAQTAGGQLPLPGRGPRRGLDADDIQHWRSEGNKWEMDPVKAN
ncbi:MAG: hypothetical protein ABFS34_16625, partial [Gemmatimonadota bacterium]